MLPSVIGSITLVAQGFFFIFHFLFFGRGWSLEVFCETNVSIVLLFFKERWKHQLFPLLAVKMWEAWFMICEVPGEKDCITRSKLIYYACCSPWFFAESKRPLLIESILCHYLEKRYFVLWNWPSQLTFTFLSFLVPSQPCSYTFFVSL